MAKKMTEGRSVSITPRGRIKVAPLSPEHRETLLKLMRSEHDLANLDATCGVIPLKKPGTTEPPT